MSYIEITAQAFGIVGLVFAIFSFQEKNNKKFFVKQALSGLMFAVNYLLIGAVAGALFNLTNLLRASLFKSGDRKPGKLIIVLAAYSLCVVFSIYMTRNSILQIVLTLIIYISLEVMSYLMWLGSGKHIRYGQLFVSSPSWLVYNSFNFTLGGIICEILSIISVIVSFIRYGKNGFEK